MKKPYPIQKKIIKKAVSHFRENDRGKIVMACGTGKTLTTLWIAKALEWERIVIAVPTLYLERQFVEEWQTQMNAIKMPHKFIVIGSDNTIEDSSTDINEISKKIKSKKDKLVILTTYASSEKLVLLNKNRKIKFDAIVFDEAHHLAGSVDKKASILLFNKSLSVKKRLFLTATPKFVRSNTSAVFSMDDKKVFGEEIFYLSLAESINLNLLTDYRVVSVIAENWEVERMFMKNQMVEIDKEKYDFKMVAAAVAVLKAMKKLGIKKIITYHSSINRAEKFKELLKVLDPKMPVYHTSSRDKSSARNDIIIGFTNETKGILTNARLFNEGVNVPSIDAVAYVDPRYSIIEIVQTLGRALRKTAKKEMSFLIVPYVFDDESSMMKFDLIKKIIRALSSTDHRLVSELVKNRGDSKYEKSNIVEVVTDSVDIDVKQIEKELNVIAWKEVVPFVKMTFEECKEFVVKNDFIEKGVLGYKYWNKYLKGEIDGLPELPLGFPRSPRHRFKEEWKGWRDFLGKNYRWNYVQAKEYLTKEYPEITSKNAFEKIRHKLPFQVPRGPQQYYNKRGSWKGWRDFLRSGNFIDYNSFKKWVKENKPTIKTSVEWAKKSNLKSLPSYIPKSPNLYYKEWEGWQKALGRKERVRYKDRGFLSYKEAKKWIQKNHKEVKTSNNWRSIKKVLPDNVPKNPEIYYKEWEGWQVFLGRNKKRRFKNVIK